MTADRNLPELETDEAIQARVRALRDRGRLVEARFAEFELNYRQSMREQALKGEA